MNSGRRPPNVNDEQVRRLIAALAAGHYMERAIKLAGVNRNTVYGWLATGRAERERQDQGLIPTKRGTAYMEILETVERAKEQAAARAMRAISDAFDKNWQAAAWYLERTDPENYARRTVITGADEGPIHIQVTAEDLDRQLANMIAAAHASDVDADRASDAATP